LSDLNESHRMPANRVRISDIVNGKYFPSNAELKKAGYVITPYGRRLFRADILGTVTDRFVNADETYCSLTIDDGTQSIRLKAFKAEAKRLMKFEVGDRVRAIGKVRDYSGETYVAAEIVRGIEDPNVESMRRLDLLQLLIRERRIVNELKTIFDDSSLEELAQIAEKKYSIGEEQLDVMILNFRNTRTVDYKPLILEMLVKLDKGKGVEMRLLFEQNEFPENIVESSINELLAEGFIYEPLPGILKKV